MAVPSLQAGEPSRAPGSWDVGGRPREMLGFGDSGGMCRLIGSREPGAQRGAVA